MSTEKIDSEPSEPQILMMSTNKTIYSIIKTKEETEPSRRAWVNRRNKKVKDGNQEDIIKVWIRFSCIPDIEIALQKQK